MADTFHYRSSSGESFSIAENPYKVLGVKQNANAAEIKSAYKSRAAASHPDRNPYDPNATQKFAEVSTAYKILSSDEVRREYDRYVSKNTRHASQSYNGRTFVSSQLERENSLRSTGHGSHGVKGGNPFHCTGNHSFPILREVPPRVKDWHDHERGRLAWERSEKDFPYWTARVRSRILTFNSRCDVMRAIDIVIESWTEACNHLVQMERDQMTITQQIEDTNEYLEDLSRRGYLSPSKEHGLLERLTMYSNDRSHIVERYHYLWKDINRMREDWIELEYILAEMKRVDGEYGSDREELRFSRGPMPPRMPSVGRAVERAHRF